MTIADSIIRVAMHQISPRMSHAPALLSYWSRWTHARDQAKCDFVFSYDGRCIEGMEPFDAQHEQEASAHDGRGSA